MESLSQCENKTFVFLQSMIKFAPSSFDENGWKATATSLPPVVRTIANDHNFGTMFEVLPRRGFFKDI